jgi:hypothetical protein
MYAILGWFASTLGARVLTSLGITFLSYGAVTAAFENIRAEFVSQWGQIPDASMKIISLAGIPGAFGFVLGAMFARLALATSLKLGRLS